MKYFEKISGERLFLSPINPEDYEIYTKWMNNQEVTEKLGNYDRLITMESEKKYLEEIKNYNFAIILREKEELIGNVSLKEIDHIDQKATLEIFIGEKKNRNKGYGKEAIKLLLNYGFNTLNLNNIMLTVYEFNKYAIRTYEKIGFKKIGYRRNSHYRNGKMEDELYMDILKRDFNDIKDYIFTE